MKKRIIAVSALMALVFTLSSSVVAGETATTSEANIPSETSTEEAKLTAGVSLTIANTLADMELSCDSTSVSINDTPTVGSSYELKAEVHELKETYDIDELNKLTIWLNKSGTILNTVNESIPKMSATIINIAKPFGIFFDSRYFKNG